MRRRINATIREEILRKFSLDSEVVKNGRSRVIEGMIEERLNKLNKKQKGGDDGTTSADNR